GTEARALHRRRAAPRPGGSRPGGALLRGLRPGLRRGCEPRGDDRHGRAVGVARARARSVRRARGKRRRARTRGGQLLPPGPLAPSSRAVRRHRLEHARRPFRHRRARGRPRAERRAAGAAPRPRHDRGPQGRVEAAPPVARVAQGPARRDRERARGLRRRAAVNSSSKIGYRPEDRARASFVSLDSARSRSLDSRLDNRKQFAVSHAGTPPLSEVNVSFPVRRLFLLWPAVALLGAPDVSAQDANAAQVVYVTDSGGDRILKVDFVANATTPVNTDTRARLTSLAVRDTGAGFVDILA